MFWGLDSNFTSVAVVGLGKPKQAYDDLENICPVKESARVAAAGTNLSLFCSETKNKTNFFCIFFYV